MSLEALETAAGPASGCISRARRVHIAMSKDYEFRTRVRWTGQYSDGPLGPRSYTRDTLVDPDGKPPIPGSAGAQFLGDDSRYNPEDLMLASLAECHLLSYLALTTKAGIRITSLTVEASGVLASIDGKMRFRTAKISARTEVELALHVARATELHRTAHESCFMSNSVNFPIEVAPHVTDTAAAPERP
jgi:organic hydroperoxide reductase OsmC/OhrA